MFRKILYFLCIVALLGLFNGAQSASADQGAPQWERVMDMADQAPNSYLWGGIKEFKGFLYAAVSNLSGLWGDTNPPTGAAIWRSADGKSWEPASAQGFGISPFYNTIWDMVVFEGQLYVAVHNQADAFGGIFGDNPPRILRTADGTTWETVYVETAGELNGAMLDKFGIFNHMIYVTTVAPAAVWRSPSGDAGTWQKAADLGDIGSTSSPVAYRGFLYLSSTWNSGGVQLWRSPDGLDWQPVGDSIRNDPLAEGDNNLVVFKNLLYFSVSSWADGGRIYRSKDGLHWELVVEHGFGLPGIEPGSYAIPDITGLTVYKSALYAPSFDLVCDCVKIWSSKKGMSGTWTLASEEPLGDPGMSWVWRGTQAVFKNQLYVGTSNALYRTVHPPTRETP